MNLSLRIPSEELAPLKPFISIVLVISMLLGLVFLQMEERRLGYIILKMTHDQRELVELKRNKEMMLAKMTRPQHVEAMAQKKFTLKKVTNSQLIQLTGAPISVPVAAPSLVQKSGRNL